MNYSSKDNVAILMPTYKGIKFIDRQIKSILNQKFVNITLYVSLDPSADGTREYLNKISKSSKNINIIEHNKFFGSPTRNFFYLISKIDERKYDYIGLSDHDDIWTEQKVIKSIKSLNKNNSDCYSGSIIAFKSKRKKYIDKSQKQTKYDHYFESAGPGSTFLFNINFVKSFKKFLLNNKKAWNFKHYDWLIYSYARENNFKWFIDKEANVLYRQHRTNYTGANWGFVFYFSRFLTVISGEAFNYAIKLSRILKYNKDILNVNLNPLGTLKLFLKANSFRRKTSEKILLRIYFLLVFLFGEYRSDTVKFSITKIFKFFLLISTIYSIDYIFTNFNKSLIIMKYHELNVFFIVFLTLTSLIIYRFFLFLNKFSKNKIGFYEWFRIFYESQVMGVLIPYSNFIYRVFKLKNSINLKVNEFLSITAFILLYEYLLLLFICSIFLIIFLKINLLSISISIAILFLTIIFNLNFNKMLILLTKYIKKINFSFINLNYETEKEDFLYKKKIFNVIEIINFNLITLIKILFNYIIFYLISEYLDLNLSTFQIFIILFINQLFEIVKLTPQNLGILELVYGFTFSVVFIMPIQDGVIFKIYHRILEILMQALMLIIIKSIDYLFLKNSKKKYIS